jgi:hypothetical protein
MQIRVNHPRTQSANLPSAKGYIPLPRTFFDHPLCRQPREYSPAEALLDLYRLARSLPTATLKRGEFQCSQPELAKRWGWRENRVKRFINARLAEGFLRRVSAKTGDVPVLAIAEMPKIPTKPAAAPPSAPPSGPPEAAPVVAESRVVPPPPEAEVHPPEQKKESTKERKASEFRECRNGESQRDVKLKPPAPEKVTALSPPPFHPIKKTATPEQCAQYLKILLDIVPAEALNLRIPLNRAQRRALLNRMNCDLLPWPRNDTPTGRFLLEQLRRPV